MLQRHRASFPTGPAVVVGMPSAATLIKGAELISGGGAVVLGAGLGLLAPVLLQRYALPLLVVGVLLHGVGMTLKYRLEAGGRMTPGWVRALFWMCWASLLATLAWVVYLILAPTWS